MIALEGHFQCCASPLTSAGLQQSWPWGNCRIPMEPESHWRPHLQRTESPSSHQVEMGRITFWTDAPSTQICFHTEERFHVWCAAISSLVFSFVLYSQRRKWLRLYFAKWENTCAAGSIRMTHEKNRDENSALPVSRLLLPVFRWTSKRKDEMRNWRGSSPLTFSISPIKAFTSVLAMLCILALLYLAVSTSDLKMCDH